LASASAAGNEHDGSAIDGPPTVIAAGQRNPQSYKKFGMGEAGLMGPI
jgi:hypothetical protein